MSEQTGKDSNADSKRSLTRIISVVGPIVAVCVGLLGLQDKLLQIAKERYGPDVIVTAVPRPLIADAIGRRSLLHEYQFTTKRCEMLHSDSDVEGLFRSEPVPITSCHCNGNRGLRFYPLSIAIQNKGGAKSEGYSLAISFSSNDRNNPDPGVRIVQAATDSMELEYLYQNDRTLECPECLLDASESGNVSTPPKGKISKLCRKTYDDIGLTRDQAIITGDLEAQNYKAVELVIAVPQDLRKFAVLYNVECANCRWLSKNELTGQLISLR